MKSWAIVAITVIIGVIFSIGIIQESFAVNSNLFVSAENSRFDNYVSGPQVIEVVIIDSNIDETNEVKGEPEVLLNGKILRMVQAVDGNWYGYFADRNMALIADGTTTEAGIGLDFGTVCTTPDEILAAQGFANIEFDTNFGVALGATSCFGAGANPTLQNVLREAKELNNNGKVSPGQIDITPDAWPLIQLYPLNPTGNIVVQYNKGGAAQTTTLTFDEVHLFADLQLDASSYINGDEVRATITDTWLNVDPTDEDSWTFGTSGTSTNYQVFDKNGNAVGDTPSNTDSDLTNTLNSLMCADNCRLLINTDANGQGIALTLQDNDNSEIRSTNPQEDGNPQNPFSWETIFGNISGDFPVTLTEQAKNSGEFTTFDEFNVSNLVITDKAVTGSAAEIDYNKIPYTILVINEKNPLVPEPDVVLGESELLDLPQGVTDNFLVIIDLDQKNDYSFVGSSIDYSLCDFSSILDNVDVSNGTPDFVNVGTGELHIPVAAQSHLDAIANLYGCSIVVNLNYESNFSPPLTEEVKFELGVNVPVISFDEEEYGPNEVAFVEVIDFLLGVPEIIDIFFIEITNPDSSGSSIIPMIETQRSSHIFIQDVAFVFEDGSARNELKIGCPPSFVFATYETTTGRITDDRALVDMNCTENAISAVDEIIADIDNLDVNNGVKNGLKGSLQNIEAILTDDNKSNDSGACNKLKAFEKQVSAKSEKHISEEESNDLLSKSEQIKNTLGC